MSVQDMTKTKGGFQPSRDQLSDFLRTQATCVIASLAQDGSPQAATVAFSETKDGSFIIGTHKTSRKAQNIQENPAVALTITDTEKRYTVQLEGKARWLTEDEFAPYEEEHFNQLPESRPFKDAPGQVHILIKPTNIRFSDCSVYPWLLTNYPSELH